MRVGSGTEGRPLHCSHLLRPNLYPHPAPAPRRPWIATKHCKTATSSSRGGAGPRSGIRGDVRLLFSWGLGFTPGQSPAWGKEPCGQGPHNAQPYGWLSSQDPRAGIGAEPGLQFCPWGAVATLGGAEAEGSDRGLYCLNRLFLLLLTVWWPWGSGGKTPSARSGQDQREFSELQIHSRALEFLGIGRDQQQTRAESAACGNQSLGEPGRSLPGSPRCSLKAGAARPARPHPTLAPRLGLRIQFPFPPTPAQA